MSHNPIACNLSVDDAARRGDEWQQFVIDHVVDRRRTPHSWQLDLDDSVSLDSVIDLVRREKDCCGSTEFRLLIKPNSLSLEVQTPPNSGVSLDSIFA